MTQSFLIPLEKQHNGSQLLKLPDEIIQHILYHVSPHDTLLNVSRTSKRLKRLSDEQLLWRHHCKTQFRYWDAKHNIRQRLQGKIGDVDWKKLYTYRHKVDLETSRTLDAILAKQTQRIEKFEALDQFGYDVKDTLLRHCSVGESAPDVLARRFYGNAGLDRLHRVQALEEWSRLRSGEDVRLERALGAFDLFVLHDQNGDLLEISELLDSIAIKLRQEISDISSMSTRQRALATIRYLRAHNLTGIASETAYRDLQNNYIGIALQDEEHPSLPLISVAIFCSLAERVGLDARSCAFPNHVHAVVYPPEGRTLDGNEVNSGSEVTEPMYLDPFGSETEVSVESLKDQLELWGVNPIESSRFLGSASTSNIVLRTSRNILATVHQYRGHPSQDDYGLARPPRVLLHANPYADMDNAFYSALWANFLLTSPRFDLTHQRNFIPMIVERFEHLYPMDASLLDRYVRPAIQTGNIAENEDFMETLKAVRMSDLIPKQVRGRGGLEPANKVKYKVGQVFRHRRYGYNAVITGWDVECGMNSQWIEINNVDALERGRHQSFYHALVEDTSIRYVAEENIEITQPDEPKSLMSLAGRYFKRWDPISHKFVSNIRDEYPDD